MTELEKLRVQLNKIVDAIVIEAKKTSQTAVPTLSSIVVPTLSSIVVPTLSSIVVPTLPAKQDLVSHIKETFTNLLNQPGKDKNIMTPYVNPYNWPRNNNCWAKNINLTGYSACVLGLGGVGGGTLITKKHVLLSNHVPYVALPFTIFFVDNNNVTVTYNVVKTKRVGGTDILIGELDREVDSRFSIFSVLPGNYVNYLNSPSATFPVLYSDQERKALLGEYAGVLSSSIDGNNAIISAPLKNSNQYFEPVIGGDSGNIVGTIINNELVLIGGWYKLHTVPNSAVCTLLSAYIPQINEVIVSFGYNGYKLKEANLSNFYRI